MTFDLVRALLDEQRAWIDRHRGAHPALVAVVDDGAGEPGQGERVLGFASLSPFRDRPAYATSVEDSVYVHRAARGRGVGGTLLTDLLAAGREQGFHAVFARIVGPNEASIRMHTGRRLRAGRHRARGRPQARPVARRRRAAVPAVAEGQASAEALGSTRRARAAGSSGALPNVVHAPSGAKSSPHSRRITAPVSIIGAWTMRESSLSATWQPDEGRDDRQADHPRAQPPRRADREQEQAPGEVPGLDHRAEQDEGQQRVPERLQPPDPVGVEEQPHDEAPASARPSVRVSEIAQVVEASRPRRGRCAAMPIPSPVAGATQLRTAPGVSRFLTQPRPSPETKVQTPSTAAVSSPRWRAAAVAAARAGSARATPTRCTRCRAPRAPLSTPRARRDDAQHGMFLHGEREARDEQRDHDARRCARRRRP